MKEMNEVFAVMMMVLGAVCLVSAVVAFVQHMTVAVWCLAPSGAVMLLVGYRAKRKGW